MVALVSFIGLKSFSRFFFAFSKLSSDRLELIRSNLDRCGIYCETNNDNIFIDPTKKIIPKNNRIRTDKDHRIAMSFAIMGTKLGIDLNIEDHEYINTSFPNFNQIINSIGGKLIE